MVDACNANLYCRLLWRGSIFALCTLVLIIVNTNEAAAQPVIGPSGLPLPRYVSLKKSPVNVRVGPGTGYKILWSYVKPGLPVEIYQEYGNWRRVRDWQASTGWIYRPLLSGQRTGIIAPWSKSNIPMRTDRTEKSRIAAWLQPKVLVQVDSCSQNWCQVAAKSVTGYVKQPNLWGVYPNEKIPSLSHQSDALVTLTSIWVKLVQCLGGYFSRSPG